MGLMDQVSGMMGGGEGGGGIQGAIGGLLRKSGGLNGLLDKFRSKGMGQKADSWVSTGENEPVSPEEVKTALGDEDLDEVANQMGVSKDEAAGKVAGVLPSIIDKLTPDGMVPNPDEVASKLTGFFK